MPETGHIVRLEFPSLFDMIDLVQAVCDQLARHLGLDDDSQHWVGVAVRESVINAIKHGNKGDASKLVTVEFVMTPAASPCELAISVRDRGEGFDPEQLPDPLAPENLLKSSGRGIFFMRNFMDDVQIVRASGGGMEVRMTKRFPPAAPSDSQPSTS
jgi:serine/threonine-protein kinase RsbW